MPTHLCACTTLSDAQQERLRSQASARSGVLRREALPAQAVRKIGGEAGLLHILDEAGSPLYAQCSIEGDSLECWIMGDDPSPALLAFIEDEAAARSLSTLIWRRASLPGDEPLDGMSLRREIVRMDADLTDFAPVPAPAGFELRRFRPGIDEQAWVDLNALAFSDHPEQAHVGLAELEEQAAEPWFDPDGFLLVEDASGLAAFCWTKVHRDPWGAAGEIYVIAVHPRCAGQGVGRFAVAAGLNHLRAKGLDAAFLYVESENDGAIQLYRSLGFAERWRDQLWQGGR